MKKAILKRFQSLATLILAMVFFSGCSFEATKKQSDALTSNDSATTPQLQAPSLSSVSPASLDTSAGGLITINGSNFVENMTVNLIAPDTSVASCTGVSFISESQITCNLPAVGVSGNYSIQLESPGINPVTVPTAVTYITPAACSSEITNNFGGGDGTLASPYRICNLNQWTYFSATPASWDKYIQLESDLDFTGINYANFKTIGNGTTAFTGVFNGNHFNIKNITVDGGSSNISLFPMTDNNATFKNLNLKNLNFTTTGYAAALVDTQGLGGTLTLEDITVTDVLFSAAGSSGLVLSSSKGINVSNVTLTNLNMGSGDMVAGVLGEAAGGDSSFSNINLTNFTVSGGTIIGGIIASMDFNSLPPTVALSNIQVTGLSIGNGSSSHVGGLIGEATDAVMTITNCSVAGTVSGSNQVAGLLGSVRRTGASTTTSYTITQSSFNGVINGASATGGLVGFVFNTIIDIQKSFSKGSLNSFGGPSGGILGSVSSNAGSQVLDSYSQMILTETHGSAGYVGGLVGTVNASKTLTIQSSFMSGVVNSSWTKGCIAAKNNGTLTLTDVYYNGTVCIKNSVNSGAYAGATALTTGNFQTATPFTVNWSTLIWSFISAQDPKLIWEP